MKSFSQFVYLQEKLSVTVDGDKLGAIEVEKFSDGYVFVTGDMSLPDDITDDLLSKMAKNILNHLANILTTQSPKALLWQGTPPVTISEFATEQEFKGYEIHHDMDSGLENVLFYLPSAQSDPAFQEFQEEFEIEL